MRNPTSRGTVTRNFVLIPWVINSQGERKEVTSKKAFLKLARVSILVAKFWFKFSIWFQNFVYQFFHASFYLILILSLKILTWLSLLKMSILFICYVKYYFIITNCATFFILSSLLSLSTIFSLLSLLCANLKNKKKWEFPRVQKIMELLKIKINHLFSSPSLQIWRRKKYIC